MQTALAASFEALTGLPDLAFYILVFVFGAAIGSFLNVVIHRVPREQSIVMPNSACPGCGSAIRPYDNIPIVSWLLLRGRCRNCSQPIAWRYPAVELLTALVFLLTAWQVGFNAFLPVALLFAATMISLVFIDAEHMILPNVITYPMFALALVIRITWPMAFGTIFTDTLHAPLSGMVGYPAWVISIAGAFLGALAGGGSLWLVGETWKRLRGVEAMGLGDVKMMFGVGALLGWQLTLLTIFLAAFVGAAAGSVMVMRTKDKDLQAQIPFGIFLGTGAVIALLFGEQLLTWYLGMFDR